MTLEFSARDKAELLRADIAGELPDARGRFGPFGGRYIPETLVPAFERLEGRLTSSTLGEKLAA